MSDKKIEQRVITSLIKELATRMRDPESVREKICISSGNNPLYHYSSWNSLSLSHGYPAALLLFAALDQTYPNESWDQISHSYVLKIKQSIETNGITSLSLFEGLAGVCFAIRQASRNNTRYQKMLKELDNYLFQMIEKTYFFPLHEKIKLNLPAPPYLYDLISGIIGIGTYFLKILDCSTSALYLNEILNICIALTKEIKLGVYTAIPRWYIPHHYQLNEFDKKIYPKGNFNMGVAHGASGLLAFLSIAALNQIMVEGQIDAIRKLADWIYSKKKIKNETIYWHVRIAFEDEVNESRQDPINFSREAWCDGNFGILRALYLAGQALKDFEFQKKVIEDFNSALQHRQKNKNKCSNPTFCHGSAGLLTITQFMMQDSELSEMNYFSDRFKKDVISYYSSEHNFGFRDKEYLTQEYFSQKNSKFCLNLDEELKKMPSNEIDNIGLLGGVSGILLSLLYRYENCSDWAFPFLISWK